jgi:hypothetical protein
VYSKFNLYYYTTTLALVRSLVVQVFLYLGKILPVLVVAAKSNAVPGYYVANTKKVVLAKVEFRLVLKLRRILRNTQIAYSHWYEMFCYGMPDVGKSTRPSRVPVLMPSTLVRIAGFWYSKWY